MSGKKVTFAKKPSAKMADDWVSGTAEREEVVTSSGSVEKSKRFTFDVPESLHRRVKLACVHKGVDMADEMRRILEQHFPASEVEKR